VTTQKRDHILTTTKHAVAGEDVELERDEDLGLKPAETFR